MSKYDDIFKAGRALGAMAESLRAAASLAALAAGAKSTADAAEATGGDATFARAAERTFADLAVAHAGAALEEMAGAASAVSPTAGALVECARRVALDSYRDAVEAKRNADGPREDVPAADAAERADGIVVDVAARGADEQRLHDVEGSTGPHARFACHLPDVPPRVVFPAVGVRLSLPISDVNAEWLARQREAVNPPACECGEPSAFVETESTTGGTTWHVKRHLCAACSARDHGDIKPPTHGYYTKRMRVEA